MGTGPGGTVLGPFPSRQVRGGGREDCEAGREKISPSKGWRWPFQREFMKNLSDETRVSEAEI